MAYTLIETVTVGSGGAASIEFTGIPQEAGADLVIVCSMRVVDNDNGKILFNGDTSTAYTTTRLLGTGSAVSSTVSTSESLFFMGLTDQNYTANTFGSAEILISNYTSSTNKSVSINAVTENNATFARQELGAGVYTTSSPITSLTLKANTTNTLEHSTASLYLVTTADATGASNPSPSATGGTISLSGGYFYHTFTSSGTFAPTTTLSCDYVVVGGGGGGWVGGGGGGNVITGSDTMNTSGKTVTIGSGGAGGRGSSGAGCGGDDYYPYATNGNQSSLVTTNNGTIIGGGGGSGGVGWQSRQAGTSGGSGGGGYDSAVGTTAGASGNGTNANNGGSGIRFSGENFIRAGGGGGAGGTPSTPSSSNTRAGDGGAGYTWLNGTAYAGGGGGSGALFAGNLSITGGNGTAGGGLGASLYKGVDDTQPTRVATSGQAGTGSGGGGSPYGSKNSFYPNDCTTLAGGAGGSGIVIIRYAA